MRTSIIALVAVAWASACDSKAPETIAVAPASPTTEACTSPVTREVALTAPDARDVLEAQVIGAVCEKASLLITLSKSDGHLLWSYAVRAEDTCAFVPADDSKPVDPKTAMDAFLASIIKDARLETSSLAPDWPEGDERPQDETGLFHTTPFLRETYLQMRTKSTPTLCVQAHQGTSVCAIYDPEFEDVATEFYTSSS
jgi:hypothetical protein